MIVYTSKSEELLLAEKAFASGGEGSVYKVISAPVHLQGTCVKIYHSHKLDTERENRIKFMVNNPPKQIRGEGFLLGWPLDWITDETGKFIGFVMPLGFPNSKELVVLTATTISKKLGDEWHSRYDRSLGKKALLSRMKLINNIAIPVHILHSTGKYVLKDFKPQNVLATADGRITMVDMDSIQISEGNNFLFSGTAATPDYMPPEFYLKGIGRTVNDVITPSWDTFALGVVFYQLLFGIHPYAVTPRNLQEDSTNDISHNIATGLFPFGVNGDMIKIRPKLHNNFIKLPDEFQEMFIRAFSDDMSHRPSAEEWGKYVYQEILKANENDDGNEGGDGDDIIVDGENEGNSGNSGIGEDENSQNPPDNQQKGKTGRILGWTIGLVAAALICFFIFQPKDSDISSSIDSFVSEENELTDSLDEGERLYELAKRESDIKKAEEYMSSAAEMGYAPAQFELGRMYYEGKIIEKDYEEAIIWYQRAIDQDNADAVAWMSDLYIYGYGVNVDYDKALQLIRRSVAQDNGYGLSNLGYMYYMGYGVSKDYNEAVKWFRKSAEKKNEWGMSWLGQMYYDGHGVNQDYSEALRWFRKVADIGDDIAMNNVGHMYKNGFGVDKDYAEAERWFHKAYEKGNVSSLNNIGILYSQGGYGIKQSYEKAHKWFQKAAEKGNSSGMYNVGYDYYYGQGVSKDIDKAKEWTNKAIKEGNESAKNLLEIIKLEEKSSQNQSNDYTQDSSNRSTETNSNSSEKMDFEVDGITYSYADPTGSQISSWKSKYKSTCVSKIRNKMSGYSISDDMVSNDPCLVYLILQSKSLDDKDKQDWFNLYESMNEEQINRLYDILYRENYKLAKIEYDYQKKREEINQKYK